MRDISLRREAYKVNWPQEEFIVPLLRNAIERLIQEFSNNISGKKVIDIGAGNQPFRKQIERMGGNYFSLEIEQNFSSSKDFSGAIDGELSNEVLCSGPFDLILCTEVLEHVANWDKAFKNFHTILKPSGVIIATTPFIYQLHEVPYDFWRPTPYAYEYFANKHSIVIKKVEKAGEFWDVLGTVLANHAYVVPIKSSIINRILNKLIAFYIRISYRLLKSRYFHKNFQIVNSLYQSTIVVMSTI